MNMEDSTTKQTYVQLLIDTLENKKKVLNWLVNVTEQQDTIATAETFDEKLFDETIAIKEDHLNKLVMLDEGFDKIYDGFKEELGLNKYSYRKEIKQLKALISEVTDISVKLMALEKRNKTKLDYVFSQKRKGIKESRMNSKTAANYYKTMARQHETHSLFYDKKN
jgi:hypothetical protein